MTRPTLTLLAVIVGFAACKRPIEAEQPQPEPPPQTTGPAPTAPEPVIPEPPKLSPQMLSEVHDTVHDALDRSLGVALTMKSYADRPNPTRVGKMQWVGAKARFTVNDELFAEIMAKDLPCDVINAGAWRRAWTGRGGAGTTFEVTPQWWTFRGRPYDAFVRVGATELTAMVFDASRKCWTGDTILKIDRTTQTSKTLGKPIGSLGPGKADAAIFGTPGKTTVSAKKIAFFDGKSRLSFEPVDIAKCAWLEWGKVDDLQWVVARFSSGKQADRCPEDVDVTVEELIEFRDQDGELVRAVRDFKPGAGAPLGKRTTYARRAMGAVELIYDGSDQHGVVEPPKGWDARCKAVHRDSLDEPVVPVSSKQDIVGLWSLVQKDKEVASAVGKRTVIEIDCVPAED